MKTRLSQASQKLKWIESIPIKFWAIAEIFIRLQKRNRMAPFAPKEERRRCCRFALTIRRSVEKILGESVRDVATDLRLIDLPDLVSYLKTGQIGQRKHTGPGVDRAVASSPTLTFGHAGMSTSNGVDAHGHRSTWNFTPGRPSLLQADAGS